MRSRARSLPCARCFSRACAPPPTEIRPTVSRRSATSCRHGGRVGTEVLGLRVDRRRQRGIALASQDCRDSTTGLYCRTIGLSVNPKICEMEPGMASQPGSTSISDSARPATRFAPRCGGSPPNASLRAPRTSIADNEFPRDLWPLLGAQGLLGITVPERFRRRRARLSRARHRHGRDLARLGRPSA